MYYKIITEGNPLEVWASGFYDKQRAERMVAEGYWHRLMYAEDKHKKLIVIPEKEAA